MYSLLIKKKNINQSLTFEVLQIYRSCGEYYSRWSGFAAQKFLMCPPWTPIRHQRLSLEEPIPLSFLGYQEDMVRLVPQYVSSGLWMLPALNPRRKAVGNCNCSTTCKENCTIHDSQNGAKVQLPEWVPGSFCLLHASRTIRPKSVSFWRLLRRYWIQSKISVSVNFKI